MRSSIRHQRRQRFGLRAAGACLALVWLGSLGCQGPQFDRLDGSPADALGGGAQLPTVDISKPAPSTETRETASAPPVDTVAQSRAAIAAVIAENLNRGHREAALNHADQAEICYRSVLELQPDHPVANHRLAVLLDRRGDFASSEKCYRAALAADPNDAELLSDLGCSYLLQGRHAESERFLLAATRANPLNQKALFNLSLLYAKIGDRDRAFDALRQAVGDSEARVRIAKLLQKPAADTSPEDLMTASFNSFAAKPTGGVAATGAPTAGSPIRSASLNTAPSAMPSTSTESQPALSSSQTVSQPSVNSPSPAQTSLEKQLAEMMERERERAIEVRVQRQAQQNLPLLPYALSPTTISALSDSALSEAAPSTSLPAAAAPTRQAIVQAGSTTLNTDRVPDDRINDVFAAIDREGTDDSRTVTPASATITEAPSAPVSRPAARNPVTPAAATWNSSQRQTTADAAPATSIDPLATMPRWPLSAPSPLASKTADSLPDTPSNAAGDRRNAFPVTSAATPATTGGAKPASAPLFSSSPAENANAEPQIPDWSQRAKWAERPEVSRSTFTPRPVTAERPSDPPGTPANWPAAHNPSNLDSDMREPAYAIPSWPPQELNRSESPTPQRLRTSVEAGEPQASQVRQTPHAAPAGVVPAGGLSDWNDRAAVQSAVGHLDSEIRPHDPVIRPGRSLSNDTTTASFGTESFGNPFPVASPGAAKRPETPVGMLDTADRDGRSPRIEPRRNLPPLFAPDDFKPTTPTANKNAAADKAIEWSDLPDWPGGPPARSPGSSAAGSSSPGSSPSADRDAGPTIRPGSF